MHVFYLHACVGDQKRALDPLKLELEIVVSHHVGPGKGTHVLWKIRVLNH